MKTYEAPKLEITIFQTEDPITTSAVIEGDLDKNETPIFP